MRLTGRTFLAIFTIFVSNFSGYSSLPFIPQQQDTLKREISYIPVINITSQITSFNGELMRLKSNILSEENRKILRASNDTLLFRIKLLREDPRIQEINTLSFRSLAKLESEWSVLKSRLQLRENELQQGLVGMQSNINELDILRTRWALTLNNAKDEQASDKLIIQVEATIDSLEYVIDLFRSDSDFLQDRMVQVSNSIIYCNRILAEIGAANSITGTHILKITQPPVWKAISHSRNDTVIISADRSVIDDIYVDLKEFGSDESVRIVLHVFILLLLYFIIKGLFRNLKVSTEYEDERAAAIITSISNRPVSVTLLLTFLISYLLYQSMPNSIAYLNLVLLFLPVILIVYDIMPVKVRKYTVLPSLAVMLALAHSYSFSDSFFSRIFLILIDLFTIVSVIFAVRKRTFRDNTTTKRMGIALYYLALSGVVLMVISLLGALAGAVRLAEFITYATLKSVAMVFVFYTISVTIISLLYTIIFGNVSSNLRILSYYREIIYKTVSRYILIITWIVWIILSLKQFSLWENVYALLSGIFGHSINIGTTSFTLANIIVFIVVIMLTIWISRVSKIIIEGEIAPRVKMKRGVPGAVTLILRITIITSGFMFAVAILGVEMDKLAILLGALGVGIGFGLQNIFNNLVSGLILAFERPIQEGDIIEVGELWGTVKEIGIRASIIFTFDGAEVIVPNGNLISKELINWTLSNQLRRVEVTVGVQYGTDPEKVLAILRKVAGSEPEALGEPTPLALFAGFGESSLDFRLLFWIDNAERRYLIQSKVNVAINKELAEAGIVIPFPQRDLHIKSVDRDIPVKLDK